MVNKGNCWKKPNLNPEHKASVRSSQALERSSGVLALPGTARRIEFSNAALVHHMVKLAHRDGIKSEKRKEHEMYFLGTAAAGLNLCARALQDQLTTHELSGKLALVGAGCKNPSCCLEKTKKWAHHPYCVTRKQQRSVECLGCAV